MARTEQSKMEMETIIRFDETDSPAILYTASARVKREWESFGFAVQGLDDGWRAECPKDRIFYKTLRKG